MLSALIAFASFLVGIPIGMFTSQFVRAKKDLPTILLFIPFLVISFFSGNPVMDELRWILLALAAGILCTWSYFDTKTKKSNNNDQ